MKWISVKDRLPSKQPTDNPVTYDVWRGHRETDVFFDDDNRQFNRTNLDFQDDFDYWEYLKGVTHWMEIEPPNAIQQ